jgi:sigma-B regulation protein RsbU (phosphoserine phosphatase)
LIACNNSPQSCIYSQGGKKLRLIGVATCKNAIYEFQEIKMKSTSKLGSEKLFHCTELWAGNELAHRSVEFAGLEANVIARPSGDREGGDLCALFSCGGAHARVVVADCVGHGFAASTVAAHVHSLLHKVRDLRNSSTLVAALNDEVTLSGQSEGGPLRLTTLVTATFDRATGEFNFAYAAHPRMLLWRSKESRWSPIGEGLTGLPIGFIAGENYIEQSIRMDEGDIVLAFSDGVTDVFSPADDQLGPEGILSLAEETMAELPVPVSLDILSETLIEKIQLFHGPGDLDDDLTMLALRRLRHL